MSLPPRFGDEPDALAGRAPDRMIVTITMIVKVNRRDSRTGRGEAV